MGAKSIPNGGPRWGDFKLHTGRGLTRGGVWRAMGGSRCSGMRAAGARVPAQDIGVVIGGYGSSKVGD